MFALLSQRRLGWLGHLNPMKDGQIPKDILCSKLTTGTRPVGRPSLCFKVVCKQDLKAGNINPTHWEAIAADRNHWRLAEKAGG